MRDLESAAEARERTAEVHALAHGKARRSCVGHQSSFKKMKAFTRRCQEGRKCIFNAFLVVVIMSVVYGSTPPFSSTCVQIGCDSVNIQGRGVVKPPGY